MEERIWTVDCINGTFIGVGEPRIDANGNLILENNGAIASSYSVGNWQYLTERENDV